MKQILGWTEGWTEVKQYTPLQWRGGNNKKDKKTNNGPHNMTQKIKD